MLPERKTLETELGAQLLRVGPGQEAAIDHDERPPEVTWLLYEELEEPFVGQLLGVQPALLEGGGLEVEDGTGRLAAEERAELVRGEAVLEEVALLERDARLRERRPRRAAGPSALPPVQVDAGCHGAILGEGGGIPPEAHPPLPSLRPAGRARTIRWTLLKTSAPTPVTLAPYARFDHPPGPLPGQEGGGQANTGDTPVPPAKGLRPSAHPMGAWQGLGSRPFESLRVSGLSVWVARRLHRWR